MAGASIFGIIIGKLRHGKKLYLVILLKVDKNLDIGFYHAMLSFGMTVRLLVKGGKEFLLNVEEIA